jgi:pilus assembly protein Flp/PilA
MTKQLYRSVKAFLLRGEQGQGLVEYALILVLVSIVAILALGAIGQNISSIFQAIANHLNPVG